MSAPITFHVIEQAAEVPSDATGLAAYLSRDKWDDWGDFQTQFYLTVIDSDGAHHGIGSVKLGERGLKPSKWSKAASIGVRAPNVPLSFDQLGESFFSVGETTPKGRRIARHLLRELHSSNWTLAEITRSAA